MLDNVLYNYSADESGELVRIVGAYQTSTSASGVDQPPPPPVAKRSNATETSPPALSALLRPHNVLGCRLRTERH
jgi:hypothetical protein